MMDFVVSYLYNNLQEKFDALVLAGYEITIENVNNGTIVADKAKATEGETIILTVTLAEGYAFYKWSVTDANSNEINVTDNTFEMPASEVKVSATFLTESRVQLAELLSYVDSLKASDYTEDSYNAVKEVRDSMSEETVTLAPDFIVTYMLSELQGLVDGLQPASEKYAIIITASENGVVTANKVMAEIGALVTLNVISEVGYKLNELFVKDMEGNDITVTNNKFITPESYFFTCTAALFIHLLNKKCEGIHLNAPHNKILIFATVFPFSYSTTIHNLQYPQHSQPEARK